LWIYQILNVNYPNCSKTLCSCTCPHGVCTTDKNCYCNYLGQLCDQKCVDSNCSLPCLCNDSNSCEENENIICMNDITVSNQTATFSFGTQFIIEGDLTIEGSNLNLSSILLISDSNITLSNSIISLNSSTIVSKECINLSKTNFLVYLPPSHIKDKLLLINSTIGCLNIDSLSITYSNEQPKCTNLQIGNDSYSIFILFKETNCEEPLTETPLPVWEIALIIVVSVIGLAIIIVVITMLIPSIRSQIFRKKKDINYS